MFPLNIMLPLYFEATLQHLIVKGYRKLYHMAVLPSYFWVLFSIIYLLGAPPAERWASGPPSCLGVSLAATFFSNFRVPKEKFSLVLRFSALRGATWVILLGRPVGTDPDFLHNLFVEKPQQP